MNDRKPMYWILAVLLSAVCAVAPALAEVSEPEPVTMQTVLATVNGQDVSYAQVRKYHEMLLAQYGSMLDASDPQYAQLFKETAIGYAVTELLIQQKAVELGLDRFTDAELEELRDTADQTYQSTFDQYKGLFAAEGTTEEEQIKAAEAYLETNGYTRQSVLEQLESNELFARVMDTVSGDLALSDDQVREIFDRKVEEAKAAYEEDPSKFDTDNMSGDMVYYVPEGVRAVKHILVMMDTAEAAQLKEYRDALAALPETDPARAELEQKIGDVMAVVQPKLDEIRAKIEAGEDFQGLIDAYGEDPGMKQGSAYRDTGYYLTEATTIYEAPFTEAALALETAGDISEPVLGSRGFHIIRYDHDVPSGAADFNAVKEQLAASELAAAKQKAESDAVAEWTGQAEVETFLDRFN